MELFGLTQPEALSPFILLALTLWSLAWKGFALWRAARGSQRNWFIAILVINTVGILEIIYIFIFSDKKAQVYSYLAKLKEKLPFS
ncbi:hypothetical protein CMO96_04245 [Candidatus Woesebacteria bacterium]|nr:hypothetical protein [Candidatus Woesebacteria bacterium]|tara:strand:- start:754 stop:1011 length:258 start_codon:yes stop_codon:yes gene_type:complete